MSYVVLLNPLKAVGFRLVFEGGHGMNDYFVWSHFVKGVPGSSAIGNSL